MYSTSIKDNRYLVRCLTVDKDIKANFFIIDTGACLTCCNYSFIDNNMREEYLDNCKTKLIGGLIKGEYVKFYKYRLKQFTIGNINMSEQYIWITFDDRVTDIILGVDILQQVILITNPYNRRMYFCKNAADYYENFELNDASN